MRRPLLFAASLALLPLVPATPGLRAAVPAPATESVTELRPGWWRDAVFYEIFVRSFADAQHGPLAGDGVGDLQGLLDHLDYLNDGRGAAGSSLGVTALWLMPISPSPSYHGYDVTDYFAVHPQFGDLALCRRFVQEAHRRGIRVIIDFVLNHSSNRHPLFQAALAAPRGAVARQLFRFAPLPEQLYGPWEQRAWHPAGDDFYYGVFSPEMPDWNFRSPAVTEHHRRAAKFWLQEVGVDGFRLDAVRYFVETGDELQDTEATRQWLREFTAYCHSVKTGSFVVGENTAHSPEIARGVRGGSLDSSFEFDLTRATFEAMVLRTPGILLQQEEHLQALYGSDVPWSSFLTNHDQDRISNKLGGQDAKLAFAAKLFFAQRGVPFIYYGDELGMTGAKPDPELRTPMPWTGDAPNAGFTRPDVQPWHAVTGEYASRNVAREQMDPRSLWSLYRRLIRLNASSPALRHGAPVAVSCSHRRVYAALRSAGDEVVLVLANFGDEPVRQFTLSADASPLAGAHEPVEEIDGVSVQPPTPGANGAFSGWQPVAELPVDAVYVIRWKKS
jgi:glycosidase